MNKITIVCLVIGGILEHVAGRIVVRQRKGSPLTRGMWILSWPFFMLAVGFSDYLAPVALWLKVPIAIVLGMVIAYVLNIVSSILNRIGI